MAPKISQISTDFSIKTKDVTDLFKDIGIDKKSGASVSDEGFDLFLEHITSKNQIKALASYTSGKTKLTVEGKEKKKSAPAPKAAPAPEVKKEEAKPAPAPAPKAEPKSAPVQRNEQRPAPVQRNEQRGEQRGAPQSDRRDGNRRPERPAQRRSAVRSLC